jgi:hypothetical protein
MILRDRKGPALAALLLVAGAVGVWTIFWSTRLGLGVSPDSVIYLEAAEHLRNGDGFVSEGRPMTRFPPLYSAMLALSSGAAGSQTEGARRMHAFLFGANVMLVGAGTFVASGASLGATVVAAAIFISSAKMFELHTMVWSEPPFLLLMLVTTELLAHQLVKPRPWFLGAIAACLSLALLTRYAGVGFLPAAVIACLAWQKSPQRTRVEHALVLSCIPVLALGAWLMRNAVVTGSVAGRDLGLHPVGGAHLRQLATTLYDFLLPTALDGYLKVAQLAVLGSLIIMGLRMTYRSPASRLTKLDVQTALQVVAMLLIATYTAFLIISISLFDFSTPLDGRILSPVYTLGLIVVVSLARDVSRLDGYGAVWKAALVATVVVVSFNLDRTTSAATLLRQEGGGFAARRVVESEAIRLVRGLPNGVTVYSNDQGMLRFLTGKPAVPIPLKTIRSTGQVNAAYGQQLHAIRGHVMRGDARVVYFNGFRVGGLLPSREELELQLGLPVLERFDDSTVYGVRTRP